jgi:undecaprenyl-diphosphatase
MNEEVIVQAINTFGRGTAIDTISAFISSRVFLAVALVLILLVVSKYDKKKGAKVILALVLAMVLFVFLNEFLIKETLAGTNLERMRPYITHSEIIPVGYLDTDSSFPSSHMTALMSVAFALCYYYRKKWIWIPSIAAVLIMALSRMHNGMHYPSDILGGIVFGLVYGLIAVKISNHLFKNKKANEKKR